MYLTPPAMKVDGLCNFTHILNQNVALKSVQAQLLAALLILALAVNGCRQREDPGIVTNVLDTLSLAKKYCGSSCHRFPRPDLLDKNTWNETLLPNMGSPGNPDRRI